jgi:hypothetical protein
MNTYDVVVKKEGSNYVAQKGTSQLSSSSDVWVALRAAVNGLRTGSAGGSTKAGSILIWSPDDGTDMVGSSTTSVTNTAIDSSITKDVLLPIPNNSQVSIEMPTFRSGFLKYTGSLNVFTIIQTNPSYMRLNESGTEIQSSGFLGLKNIQFDPNRANYGSGATNRHYSTALMIENNKYFRFDNVRVDNRAHANPPNSNSVGIDLKNHNNERSSWVVGQVMGFSRCIRCSMEHITAESIYVGDFNTAGLNYYGVPYMCDFGLITGLAANGNLILNESTMALSKFSGGRVQRVRNVFDEGSADEFGLTGYGTKGATIKNADHSRMLVETVQQRFNAAETIKHPLFDGNVGGIRVHDSFYVEGMGEDGFGRRLRAGMNYLGLARQRWGWPAHAEELSPGAAIAYGFDTHGAYEQVTATSSAGSDAGLRYPNISQRRIPHYTVSRFALDQLTACRFFAGMANTNIGNMVGSSTPGSTHEYFGLGYDSGVNGNWRLMSRNGSSPQVIDTGVAAWTTPCVLILNLNPHGNPSGAILELWRGDADAKYWQLEYQWPNQSDTDPSMPQLSTNLHYIYALETLSGAGAVKSARHYGVNLHSV